MMRAKISNKCTINTVLTIEARYIAALSLFCGNSDDQECFGGICFEIRQVESRLVATNGHMLAVARIQQKPENFIFPILDVVVPVDLFKSVTPSGSVKIEIVDQLVRLSKDGDEILSHYYPVNISYDGTTISGNSLETPFPNWRQVIPKKVSGKIAQFNPHYIGMLGKVQEILSADSDAVWVGIGHNGKGPALVEFSDRNFIAVIMPTTSQLPRPKGRSLRERARLTRESGSQPATFATGRSDPLRDASSVPDPGRWGSCWRKAKRRRFPPHPKGWSRLQTFPRGDGQKCPRHQARKGIGV